MHLLLYDLRSFEGMKSAFAFGDEHHAVLEDGFNNPNLLFDFLQLKGHEQLAIRPISPEIEDVFIQLMQAQES
jgi:hypothetical protein